MTRGACWLAACALTVPLLAACGSASDVARGSGNLSDALSYVPAEADSVTVTDWGGLREEFPAIATQSGDIATLMGNVPSVSGLAPYLSYMQDEFGWSVVDADWEMRWTAPPGAETPVGPMTVKLPDSVDLSAFQQTLQDDGFTGSTVGSGTLWTIDLEKLTAQIPLTAWWVDDKTHIVKASVTADKSAMTVAGAPSEDLTDLADDVGDAYVAQLSVGRLACMPFDPAAAVLGEDSDDAGEKLRRMQQEYADLEKPTARAEAWKAAAGADPSTLADSTARVVMTYESADAARSDHDARLSLLENGVSAVTARPYSDLYAVTDDSVSGSTSVYTIGKGAAQVFDAVYAHDWPFAVCPS
jgi:hypothetical protein